MEQIHQMISAEMNSAPAGEMFVVGLGASAGGWKLCSSSSALCPPTAASALWWCSIWRRIIRA